MINFDSFTFTLLNDSTKIIRRIYSLILRADLYFEGRPGGENIVAISKKWIMLRAEPSSLVLLEKCNENWKNHFEEYPEFIINKLLDTLVEFEEDNVALRSLALISSQLSPILKSRKSFFEYKTRELARNLIAEFGYQCFSAAISIVHDFEKRNLGLSNDDVPALVKSRYIEVEELAYFLTYSGALFITYLIPNKRYFKKEWCTVCFRRTVLGSSTCKLHQYRNINSNSYRFGLAIRNALIKTESEKFMAWEDLKICITDCEDEELELKLTFDFPKSDWKKALISFVKSKPSLVSRLSIVEIDKFQSWGEAVDYLRYQLENLEEKSKQLQAVWSWLVMAANWFEIEDIFISEDGKKLRVSRSEGAVLPTRQLILNELKMNRNIEIQEIAQKCGLTQRGIRYCIAKHEVLRKIYYEEE